MPRRLAEERLEMDRELEKMVDFKARELVDLESSRLAADFEVEKYALEQKFQLEIEKLTGEQMKTSEALVRKLKSDLSNAVARLLLRFGIR